MGVTMSDLRRSVIDAALHKENEQGNVASFETNVTAKIPKLVSNISPIQDLHGYSNPWPAGGGKNTLDISNATSYGTSYGLSGSVSDEVITISGTYTGTGAAASFRVLNNIPNGGQSLKTFEITSGNNITKFRWDGSNDRLIVDLKNLTPNNSYDIKAHLVGYTGTAPTEWTPYENLCPITGRTGVTAWRTGKNLLPNLTGARSATSIFIGQTNATTFSTHLMAGVPYTLTFTADGTSPQAYYKKNNGNNMLWGNSGTTKTFAEDVDVQMWIYATGITSVTDFQLELGSTASDYSAYSGATYPVSWQTEAGTVYGGTLNVLTGTLTVDSAIVTLDSTIPSGTSGIRNITKFDNCVRFEYYPYRSIGKGLSAPLISDKFKNAATNANVPWVADIGSGTSPRMYVCMGAEYTTDALIRQWFSNNPTTFVYKLATIIEYSLTPTVVRPLIGRNNIWADCGSVDVDYWKH